METRAIAISFLFIFIVNIAFLHFGPDLTRSSCQEREKTRGEHSNLGMHFDYLGCEEQLKTVGMITANLVRFLTAGSVLLLCFGSTVICLIGRKGDRKDMVAVLFQAISGIYLLLFTLVNFWFNVFPLI